VSKKNKKKALQPIALTDEQWQAIRESLKDQNTVVVLKQAREKRTKRK
jgi:Spy/CpxP family protein refolding chaperone